MKIKKMAKEYEQRMLPGMEEYNAREVSNLDRGKSRRKVGALVGLGAVVLAGIGAVVGVNSLGSRAVYEKPVVEESSNSYKGLNTFERVNYLVASETLKALLDDGLTSEEREARDERMEVEHKKRLEAAEIYKKEISRKTIEKMKEEYR